MCKEINVINKAEKDLNITVNNVDRNIQIIINTKKTNIDLLVLKAGETFKVNNVEYIVLEQLDGNQTAVIRKELIEDEMEFDSDNNDWRTSSIKKFLNGEYLEEIENVFGKDRIVEHVVDLLSLDGLDDYGTSIDKVSLLSIDQYRKYRKVLGENTDNPWWLITPDSTSSGKSSRYVRYVRSDGCVDFSDCGCDGVCVRFLSFNLERSDRLLYLKSLNLAREWMLARKYTLRSGVVNYKSSDKFCSGDFLMGE
jgi:hypothetical protein